MTGIPPAALAYLSSPELRELWQRLRVRLEGNGHAIRGTITVDLDHPGADRLGGLLGHRMGPGRAKVKIADLDAALRTGAAGRGLVAVVAELTGSPLRDKPAERAAFRADREQVWATLEELLVEHCLADREWVAAWTEWLHRGGVLTRLSAPGAVLKAAVTILADVLAERGAPDRLDRGLAELASEFTGDAHGLDGTPVASLVLRAVALASAVPPARSASDRRKLWQLVGIDTDEISGTVITYGLRPPGTDRWSAMMRERAELGLITHLTVHELRQVGELTRPGELIHVCENPQVLQRLACGGVDRPVACTSGNPSAAAGLLLSRVGVRYHGDFDWPGIGIAARILRQRAQPWRLGHDDYLEAVDRIPVGGRLSLLGSRVSTPWDAGLAEVMYSVDVAVHEEAIIDLLLADLG